MKIKWGDRVCRVDRNEPSMIGMVEQIRDEIYLTVRWSDGSVTEHTPSHLQVLI